MRPHFNNEQLSPEDLEFLANIEQFHKDEENAEMLELLNTIKTQKEALETMIKEQNETRLKHAKEMAKMQRFIDELRDGENVRVYKYRPGDLI